jgi:hypothetical protein
MRRLVHAFFVVAIAVGSTAAYAAVLDAAKIAEVKQAATAFETLGKDAYQSGGTPPRQSDPAVKKLLDTVFDTSTLNGPPPLTFAQFLLVNDWLFQVVNAGIVYVTAGTGVENLLTAPSVTPQQQQQMNANVVAFAPEIGRYYDAQLAVTRVEIELVMGEVVAHPDEFKSGNRAQGVDQMRSGLTETLKGVLTTFQISGADPAWLRDRLPALAAIAPSAAKFLQSADKQQLHDLAQTVAGAMTDNTIKTGLTSFAKVLAP